MFKFLGKAGDKLGFFATRESRRVPVQGARYVGGLLSRLLRRNPENAIGDRTFEEYVEEKGLTEHAIAQNRKRLLIFTAVYGVMALLLAVYSVRLLYLGTIWGGINSVLLTIVVGLCAAKVHYMAFQLKERDFSVGIRKWLSGKISD